MRKMFLLSFMLMAVAFVSCEKMYEDEPYEPMAEDFINEEVTNPFGVVELNEEHLEILLLVLALRLMALLEKIILLSLLLLKLWQFFALQQIWKI